VTDLATGKTISCLVTDAQPYSPSRVVDLAATSFAQLAPLARGVVVVRVTW
jgi:rare lipoprotein A (peptidoglycan hydrolase)